MKKEILVVDDSAAIRQLVRRVEGMVTTRRDGMLKVQQGITTPGEVLRNVFSIV